MPASYTTQSTVPQLYLQKTRYEIPRNGPLPAVSHFFTNSMSTVNVPPLTSLYSTQSGDIPASLPSVSSIGLQNAQSQGKTSHIEVRKLQNLMAYAPPRLSSTEQPCSTMTSQCNYTSNNTTDMNSQSAASWEKSKQQISEWLQIGEQNNGSAPPNCTLVPKHSITGSPNNITSSLQPSINFYNRLQNSSVVVPSLQSSSTGTEIQQSIANTSQGVGLVGQPVQHRQISWNPGSDGVDGSSSIYTNQQYPTVNIKSEPSDWTVVGHHSDTPLSKKIKTEPMEKYPNYSSSVQPTMFSQLSSNQKTSNFDMANTSLQQGQISVAPSPEYATLTNVSFSHDQQNMTNQQNSANPVPVSLSHSFVPNTSSTFPLVPTSLSSQEHMPTAATSVKTPSLNSVYCIQSPGANTQNSNKIIKPTPVLTNRIKATNQSMQSKVKSRFQHGSMFPDSIFSNGLTVHTKDSVATKGMPVLSILSVGAQTIVEVKRSEAQTVVQKTLPICTVQGTINQNTVITAKQPYINDHRVKVNSTSFQQKLAAEHGNSTHSIRNQTGNCTNSAQIMTGNNSHPTQIQTDSNCHLAQIHTGNNTHLAQIQTGNISHPSMIQTGSLPHSRNNIHLTQIQTGNSTHPSQIQTGNSTHPAQFQTGFLPHSRNTTLSTQLQTGAMPIQPVQIQTGTMPVSLAQMQTGFLPHSRNITLPTPIETGTMPINPVQIQPGSIPPRSSDFRGTTTSEQIQTGVVPVHLEQIKPQTMPASTLEHTPHVNQTPVHSNQSQVVGISERIHGNTLQHSHTAMIRNNSNLTESRSILKRTLEGDNALHLQGIQPVSLPQSKNQQERNDGDRSTNKNMYEHWAFNSHLNEPEDCINVGNMHALYKILRLRTMNAGTIVTNVLEDNCLDTIEANALMQTAVDAVACQSDFPPFNGGQQPGDYSSSHNIVRITEMDTCKINASDVRTSSLANQNFVTGMSKGDISSFNQDSQNSCKRVHDDIGETMPHRVGVTDTRSQQISAKGVLESVVLRLQRLRRLNKGRPKIKKEPVVHKHTRHFLKPKKSMGGLHDYYSRKSVSVKQEREDNSEYGSNVYEKACSSVCAARDESCSQEPAVVEISINETEQTVSTGNTDNGKSVSIKVEPS
ncbi:uncharacterized protein LOC102806405 [Saccoglossus kowalevskii]|uniref:Uncharacterized threonine-rich GPI-anchored glycoprotein PJ4664.02-like n=1 Tax=Saccoglossus kowalevskii TaxID=10224 RepID=A0ABM0M7J1_SACKO|nr:PREDICTED: uncharacterized threonine-rich GPI-anchored glycoprotein PJ4664.02-like [Saccoglossus kowalevskii]